MNNNYIIIGDSITYGIGDFESGGWAAMFKNYIVKKDDTKKCSNYVHVAGFPGATSTDILSKIDSILKLFKSEELLKKEDFIDGLHPNHNGHKKICNYIIENIE